MKQNVEQLLRSGQSVIVPVAGYSMYPLFKPQDQITIEPAGIQDVKPGNIVLFRDHQNRLAVHRIYEVGDGEFSAVGDNQTMIEEGILFGNLIGLVTAVGRSGKCKSLTGRKAAVYARYKFFTLRYRKVTHRLIKALKSKK
jgi:signal peptidase I